MGTSLLITTPDKRLQLMGRLLLHATAQGQMLTATVRVAGEWREGRYNAKTDVYQVPAEGIEQDLLEFYCRRKGLSWAEGGEQFCLEFNLSIDVFHRVRELMEYIGYHPWRDALNLRSVFAKLTMVGPERVERFRQAYLWDPEQMHEAKVLVYTAQGEEYAAFTVRGDRGTLTSLRLLGLVPGTGYKIAGETKYPPQIFPLPGNIEGDEEVLLVNDEDNVLTARSHGAAAFCVVGKLDDVHPALLAPFAGRKVVIAYDAGDGMHQRSLLLAEKLQKIASTIAIVDWAKARNGIAGIRSYLAQQFRTEEEAAAGFDELLSPVTFGGPVPLRRPLADPGPYPVDVLPPVILDAVSDVAGALGCDPTLAAQSFLAAAALASQGFVNVVIDGRVSPSSCYFVSIAESGERKSSIDRLALAPFQNREAQLSVLHQVEMQEYEIQLTLHKKRVAESLREVNREAALRAMGPPPVRPLDASLTCEEPSYEGLVDKLVHGQPSIGVFSDEGGRFLGGCAMARDNQLKTIAGLSSLWDGRSVTRVRVKADNVVLNGRRVCVHLMLQPAVADQLFGSDLMLGQGLLSRILAANPPSTIGTRAYSGIDLSRSAALQRYNERLTEILTDELPVREGTINELEPHALGLSDDAMAIWIAFHDEIEAAMRDGGEFATVRGFAAKAAEHAARLACVMTYVDDPGSIEIPAQMIEGGIAIARYHLNESLRLFGVRSDDLELRLAERCLEWLRQNFPTFSLVELYQSGPAPVRNKQAAERVVKTLDDHGWIARIEGGAFVGNHRRKRAWRVVAG